MTINDLEKTEIGKLHDAEAEEQKPERLKLVNASDRDLRPMDGAPPISAEFVYTEESFEGEGISIKRVPQVPSTKFIKFGDKFWKQPLIKACTYIWSLASALNSALDLMQQERNQVIKICEKQEEQIKLLQVKERDLMTLLTKQMAVANEKATARATELMDAKAEIVKLRSDLEGGCRD